MSKYMQILVIVIKHQHNASNRVYDIKYVNLSVLLYCLV